MQADQAFRKTFLPQTGALARRLQRDSSFGSVGALATRQPPTPARGSDLSSSPWQRHALPTKSSSLDRLQDIPEGQMQMPRCSSLPSLVSRQAPGPPLREPGALLGKSASQAGGPTASISDLIARAQQLVPVKELPGVADLKAGNQPAYKPAVGFNGPQGSLQSVVRSQPAVGYNKSSRIREAKQLLGYSEQSAIQASEKPSMRPIQPTPQASPPKAMRRTQSKLSSWTTKEESNKLAQELVRLGKPPETMKWVSEDIENKWLRREATFEMFKELSSLCGTRDSCSGAPGSAFGMEGSTRTPTPEQYCAADKVSDFEHDSLSNLVGKQYMAGEEWC